MVYGFGCVHPVGESSEYDGLFFKGSEMRDLATKLKGKPLRIEHTDEAVGVIEHAWVGHNSPELYVLFETSKTFPGLLAKNLIERGVCTDLSLGHNVKIDHSHIAGRAAVVDKEPVEVSICEQGARPNTHIFAFHTASAEKNVPPPDKTKMDKYILTLSRPTDTSTSASAMSAETLSPTPAATTTDAKQPMFSELLQQMKQQQGDFLKLQQQFEHSEKLRQSAEQQVEASNKRKRDQREQTIEGTLKDYVKHMIDTYKTELQPHASELANMFTSMKETEQSEPMLQLLSCAAAYGKKSTSELEQSFQETKRLKLRLDESEKKLVGYTTPAFSKTTERFVDRREAPRLSVAPAQPTPVLPPGLTLPRASRDGMQVRNPNLWNQLSSGHPGPGMGWFQEPKLTGRDYANGSKPKSYSAA